MQRLPAQASTYSSLLHLCSSVFICGYPLPALCCLSLPPEGTPGRGRKSHITAPSCHGTNSSAPKPCFSLLLGSPDAVARISLKIFSPASCTPIDPSRI